MSDLTEVLRCAGVARVYGVVEDSLTPFVDAVWRTEGMAWVEVRDESAAALAAADEAQATGELAVCAGSYGAGKPHLIHGLYDAHRTGAPVLAVASYVSTEDEGVGHCTKSTPSACSPSAATIAGQSATRRRSRGSPAPRCSTRWCVEA